MTRTLKTPMTNILSRREQSLMRHGRRRGQALLLAVVLMIFAALLGSIFITVVALNLSQTSREEQRTDARIAAEAGLRFINDQITGSAEGERWRPEMIAPPPAPGDVDYNT